jgi:hypothetical protein
MLKSILDGAEYLAGESPLLASQQPHRRSTRIFNRGANNTSQLFGDSHQRKRDSQDGSKGALACRNQRREGFDRRYICNLDSQMDGHFKETGFDFQDGHESRFIQELHFVRLAGFG